MDSILLERRYEAGSTAYCTQYTKKDRHQCGSVMHADAIMDRIVSNALWIDTGTHNIREYAAAKPVVHASGNAVAPTDATTGPQRQYWWPPEAMLGGPKPPNFQLAEVPRAGLTTASPGAIDGVMRTRGLYGVVRAKRVYATAADADVVRAPDLLDRAFTSGRPAGYR